MPWRKQILWRHLIARKSYKRKSWNKLYFEGGCWGDIQQFVSFSLWYYWALTWDSLFLWQGLTFAKITKYSLEQRILSENWSLIHKGILQEKVSLGGFFFNGSLQAFWRSHGNLEIAQILFPWEEGKGNKERHNTGDVRGLCHFLVYSARAAEANNKEEKAKNTKLFTEKQFVQCILSCYSDNQREA